MQFYYEITYFNGKHQNTDFQQQYFNKFTGK